MMRIPLLIAFLSISALAIGQSGSSVFDPNAYNKKFLEHLIKTKVDSVRQTVGLPALANDSILYLASNFHADYCLNQGGISHYEVDVDSMYSPQKRGEAFGAKNYQIGENIVKGSTRKGRSFYTYDQISSSLVRAWVNSPGHYKNMTSPDYQVCGLSAVYDPQRKMVISVQKFAKVNFKYEFEENKEMFNFSNYVAPPLVSSFDGISHERILNKYAYNIAPPKKDSIEYCKKCNDAVERSNLKHRLQVRGNKIIFSTADVDMMFDLIKGWRDGVAVEVVEYEPVDCGNPEFYTMPSRRNNQSMLNGRVLEPVYKKKLKRGFKKSKYKWYFKKRKKGDAKYFEMKVATLPRDLDGYYEVNLILLKKNKACRIMHFSDACGKKLTGDRLGLPYKMPIEPQDYTFRKRTDSLVFRVPFQRGKYDYVYKDIKPILDSVTSSYFIIDSAQIEAFSSIEGSAEINKNLQLKRAESIVSALRSNQELDFPYTVSTEANWRLMQGQIDQNKELQHFLGSNQPDIKTDVEANREKYERFLKDQRYAEVKLHVTYEVKDTILFFQNLYRETEAQLDLAAANKIDLSEMDKLGMMLDLETYTYQVYKRLDSLDQYRSEIKAKLDYPKGVDINRLAEIRYSMILNLGVRGKDTASAGHFILEETAYWKSMKWNTPLMNFNYMVGLLGTEDPKYDGAFMELTDRAYPLFFQKHSKEPGIDRVEIAYHLRLANLHHFFAPNRDDEKMRMHCEKLLAQTKHWDDTMKYKLSKFFSYCEQDDLAYYAIQENALSDKPYHPSLIHFAKLSFYHMDEYKKEDYSNWLMYIRSILTQEEWCHMFVGECNISFQVFDHENLRKFYCQECAEFPNYAQQPELWK